MERVHVDVWLDPLCPWSWLTAEWLLEVQERVPVDLDWRVMSLAILNEGQEIPEEWQELMRQSWAPVRALEATRQTAPESFVPLLRGIAQRWHVYGRRDLPAVLDEAVAEAGLPSSIATLAWTDDLDEDVRLSHKRAMALGGDDVGSPILGFVREDGEEVGFYGPIVSRIPRGDDAVRVFEATRTLVTTPGFFELKRTRDEEPWLP